MGEQGAGRPGGGVRQPVPQRSLQEKRSRDPILPPSRCCFGLSMCGRRSQQLSRQGNIAPQGKKNSGGVYTVVDATPRPSPSPPPTPSLGKNVPPVSAGEKHAGGSPRNRGMPVTPHLIKKRIRWCPAFRTRRSADVRTSVSSSSPINLPVGSKTGQN